MSLRESLKKAADEGDEKAKRALKAYDEEEKPKAEAEDDDEKAKTAEDEKDEAKAEDEADDKDAKAEDDDEKKKEEARAGSSATAAASASVETDLAATVQRMNAELESFKAKAAAQERAEFMATRPDLAPDLVKSLAKLPLERAKEIVATIPKAFSPKTVDPAASAARGAGQDGNDDGAAARPNDDLDREMGLADLKPQAHYDAKSGVFTLGMRAAEAK